MGNAQPAIAPAEPAKPAASFDEDLKGFQALTDYQERKAYYESHPGLWTFISPVNFH